MTATEGMAYTFKTIIKWAGFVVSLLILLVTLLTFFLYVVLVTPPVQNKVLAMCQHYLDSKYDSTVTIGSVSTNLLSEVTIHNIVVHSRTQDGDSLCIGKLHAEYLAPLLLMRKVVLTKINIEEVTAKITIGDDGDLPLLRKFVKEPLLQTNNGTKGVVRDTPWEVAVNAIKVVGVTGWFKDLQQCQSAFVESASVHGTYHKNRKFNFYLRIKGGHYTSDWWCGDISTLISEGTLSAEGIGLSKVLVQADRSKLMGKGAIPFSRNGVWDLSMSVSSDVAAVPVIFAAVPALGHRGAFQAEASWKGTIDHPLLHVELQGTGLLYESHDVDSVSVHATYFSGDTIRATLSGSTSVGRVEGEGVIEIERLMSPHLLLKEYDATLHVANVRIENIDALAPKVPEQLQGTIITGVFTAQGTGVSSLPHTIGMDAKITGCHLLDDTLNIAAVLRGKKWQISSQMLENSLVAQGILQNNEEIEGTIHANIVSPNEILQHFLPGKALGTWHIEADVGGTVREPLVTALVTCRNSSWQGITIDSCRAKMELSSKMQLLDTLDLAVQVGGDVLSSLYLEGKKVKGNFSAVITGSGILQKPDMHAVVKGTEILFGKVAADTALIELSLCQLDSLVIHNGYIAASPMNLGVYINGEGVTGKRAGTLNVEFKYRDSITTHQNMIAGDISLSGSMLHDSLSIDLAIKKLLLEALSLGDYGLPIEGVADVQLSVRGKRKNPSITSSFEVSGLNINNVTVDTLTTSLHMTDSLVTVSSVARFLTGKQNVVFNGVIPLVLSNGWKIDTTEERPLSATLVTEGVSLTNIAASVDSQVSIDGLSTLALSAGLKDKSVYVNGNVAVKNGSVTISKEKVAAQGIDVTIDVDGPLHAPRGRFKCASGQMNVRGGRISSVTALGTIDLKEIDMESMTVMFPDSGVVVLDGKIPVGKPGATYPLDQINIRYSIRHFPLAVLASLLPENYFRQGSVQGNGGVQFINRKPCFSGNVTVDNAYLITENIQPECGPLRADIQFSGDSVVLKEVDIQWGSGTIAADGLVVYQGDRKPVVTFNLHADNCSWNTPDIFYGAIDHASLQGTTRNEKIVVAGKVQLGPSRYIQDLQITDIFTRLTSGSVKQNGSNRTTLLDDVLLNVEVDLQNNALIDMNLGNLKLDGNCLARGSAAKPVIMGEVSVVEGYILYLDRKFEIDHATISNFDPQELLAVIDLRATADILSLNGDQADNYTILLSLKGDLSNPVFTLKDQTGMLNELEIISILTLGQPFGGMSGDIKDRLTSFVSQSLLGFGSRRLEQFLSIEKFDLKGDIFDGKQIAENTHLTIAKRITPRLMVLYESDIGKRNRPKLSALYRIAKNIFLSGETDSEGEAGVDIIFKYSK